MKFQQIFRALQYRNYRLFFIGQSISLVGTWMQQIAMSWLVYRLTHSPFLLGAVAFAGQIPTFLLAPLAGVIADRYNRKQILVLTQTLALAQAFILALLVLTNHVAVWHLVALSIFLGFVSAFDIPVRQAFTVEMIERRDDLGNAIALNSSMVNLARLIGPSIAGILIAAVGEGICFLLNAVSYLAVIASLLAMRIIPREIRSAITNVSGELKEGFRYAFGSASIKSILLLLGLVSLAGMPYQVLMPVFAKEIFHGGPQTFGFLMAFSGIGALAGAVYLAGRQNSRGLSKIFASAASLFGTGIIFFSWSRILWFSMGLIFVAGFGMMVLIAASNTVLQTIVEEDKRGRIMSFYTMAFMGMAPFGSLLAGSLASRIGASHTLFIGGVFCVLGSLLFAVFRPSLHD